MNQEPPPSPPRQPHKGGPHRKRGGGGPPLPEILYHATDAQSASLARERGRLELGGGRAIFMSRSESQAWQVAHRRRQEPAVLYIDVTRARRSGTHFERNRRGLWQARTIPVEHILNLRRGFGHQLSAGGFPVFYGKNGPEIALIKVRRRFGTTWEVAKGKLEHGESPVACAEREIQEEMGASMDLEQRHDLGFVRFGFMTPEGETRLKTLFVYVFAAAERTEQFEPAEGESVEDADWFTPQRALRVVTHRSLQPVMQRLKGLLSG